MTSAIEVRISAVERLARGETVEPPASGGMPGGAVPGGGMPSDAAGQQAMIEGMVARLAGRLAADGKDPAGWAQLMRSYMVLGRKDDAAKALSDARKVLGDDASALEQVNTAAAELGVEGAAEEEKK
jgi:cytochrome c-type biogenesis protein CcmH